MSFFPTKEELAVLIRNCAEAREAAREAEGLERLQLIHKSFPYAITGGDAHGLRINWHPTERGFTIADGGGFITIIPENHTEYLFILLGMEAARSGAVRELITGQKRAEARRSALPPIPEHKPKRQVPGRKISLADIGLKKPEANSKEENQ